MSGTGCPDRRTLLRRGAALGMAGAAAGMGGAPLRAMAQEATGGKLKEILDRGKLIVGTGTGNPPFHYEGADGQMAGLDIDLARFLARGLFGLSDEQMADPAEMAKRLELVVETLDERIPNLLAGTVDIVLQYMAVTPARALEVEFSLPYFREAVALLLPVDAEVDSAAELTGTGAKMSVVQASISTEMVQRGVPDAEITTYPTVDDVVGAMDAGEVEVAVVDLSNALYRALQAPERYKVSTDSWWHMTFGAAVAPGDQRWLNWVDTCLHELMVGVDFVRFAEAYDRNFGVEPPVPEAGFPVEFRKGRAAGTEQGGAG